MIRLRHTLVAASALTLAACNMAPKYVQPGAPVASSLPQGPAYPVLDAGDGQIDALGWRDFFSDTRLQDVIALALASNRDLRVAVANVAQARALYRVDRAGLFPTLGVSADGSATRRNGATTQNYSVLGGITSFEIDLFGKLRNQSASAFQTYLATDEGRKATQIAIVAEAATAWLTYAATSDALRIAQETLASQQATLRVNERREQNGIGTRLEVAQAQTLVDSARAAVADYQTDLAQARNALELLTGAPVADALLPQTLGAGDQVRASLPVGLSSGVLLRRPDVLAAEHDLRATYADIGAARAAFFPSISLTSVLGFASSSLSSLFQGGSFQSGASGAASQTIFNGGKNQGNLAYAKASRDAALASYEKAVQAAFQEVADALARRGTIDEKVAAQVSLADNAAKALTLTESRYRNGVATYLEPLDAQRTSYSARQALVTARLAKAANMVELYRTLGGGLRD